MAIIELFTSIV